MSEKTFEVTFEPTGRTWTLRPVPKHLYLMFGQLPNNLTERAISAIKSEDNSALENELKKTLSPEEMMQSFLFVREAVNYACVKPRIVLNPQTPDEISPFVVTEEEFAFLTKFAFQGGQAAGLDSFRQRPDQAAGDSVNGKKRGKKRK